jgi:hypothetical protein
MRPSVPGVGLEWRFPLSLTRETTWIATAAKGPFNLHGRRSGADHIQRPQYGSSSPWRSLREQAMPVARGRRPWRGVCNGRATEGVVVTATTRRKRNHGIT